MLLSARPLKRSKKIHYSGRLIPNILKQQLKSPASIATTTDYYQSPFALSAKINSIDAFLPNPSGNKTEFFFLNICILLSGKPASH
jgi:hypothetical protein